MNEPVDAPALQGNSARTRKLVAAWQVLCGLAGLLLSLPADWRLLPQLSALTVALFVLVQAYFLACAVAGIALWRDTRRALWVSAAVQLPQAVAISSAWASFHLFFLLRFGPSVGLMGPGAGFDFGSAVWHFGANPGAPWLLQLNLVPVALLVFLHRESARRAGRRGAQATAFG